MLDDPTVDKLIIFALAGMVAVLGIAVIVLAVKKNSYYVDSEGRKMSPDVARKMGHMPMQSAPAAVPDAEEAMAQPFPAEDVQRPTVMPRIIADDPADDSGTLSVPLTGNGGTAQGVEVQVTSNGKTENAMIRSFPCVIGRETVTCDLAIEEPAVSRRHARIVKENGSLFIEDISEHNGTYLNGVKLPPLGKGHLSVGDRISLGRAEIDIVKIF
jgi:predicted component of type VI protein secretion system